VAIDAKEDVLRTIESDIAFYKQEDETDAIMNTLASANNETKADIISLCSDDTHTKYHL